jgi:GT2 family glycosyltransferase
MFVFGCVIGSDEKYAGWAKPSIEAVAEPDTAVIGLTGQTSIFEAYNDILVRAAKQADLEGVILVHDDVEIADPDLLEKLRRSFADPKVGIVGAIGGVGVNSVSWWECEKHYGSITWDWLMDDSRRHLFDESMFRLQFQETPAAVDVVDGLLLAISPRGARELRFDEDLGLGFHGYDADICFQARQQGLKVLAEDLDLVHHNDAALPDRAEWMEGHIAFARKWGF